MDELTTAEEVTNGPPKGGGLPVGAGHCRLFVPRRRCYGGRPGSAPFPIIRPRLRGQSFVVLALQPWLGWLPLLLLLGMGSLCPSPGLD